MNNWRDVVLVATLIGVILLLFGVHFHTPY